MLSKAARVRGCYYYGRRKNERQRKAGIAGYWILDNYLVPIPIPFESLELAQEPKFLIS
jgi:hypothetical protein